MARKGSVSAAIHLERALRLNSNPDKEDELDRILQGDRWAVRFTSASRSCGEPSEPLCRRDDQPDQRDLGGICAREFGVIFGVTLQSVTRSFSPFAGLRRHQIRLHRT
jgi:hypothetical protein